MKQFWFNLTVAVVAETETEALDKFCNNPGAFDFCHDDLTTTFIEDLDFITVLNQEPSDTGEFNRVLYKLRALLMDMPLEDRVKSISEVSRMMEECW